MLNLEFPWLLLLLPLPWLVMLLRQRQQHEQQAALLHPEFSRLQARRGHSANTTRHPLQGGIMRALAWSLLLLAASNPLWLGKPMPVLQKGRNILLAVDISGSMATADMKIIGQTMRRIDAVKMVLNGFISRRPGDRIGLILFGERAYLQTPLTFDHTTVNKMLQQAVIGLAGARRTAIGDAIGLSVKRLRAAHNRNAVLILLTDGANNSGELSPQKAADIARASSIKIYSIGIGANEMIQRTFFGQRKINPSADLDVKMLKEIAAKTGGHFFRAHNPQELESIYRMLDKLEPSVSKKMTARSRTSLFLWPALLALLLLSLPYLLNVPGDFRQRRHANKSAVYD